MSASGDLAGLPLAQATSEARAHDVGARDGADGAGPLLEFGCPCVELGDELRLAICFARGTTLMYVMPLVVWLAFDSARDSWSEYLEDKREHENALNVCREALKEFEAQR